MIEAFQCSRVECGGSACGAERGGCVRTHRPGSFRRTVVALRPKNLQYLVVRSLPPRKRIRAEPDKLSFWILRPDHSINEGKMPIAIQVPIKEYRKLLRLMLTLLNWTSQSHQWVTSFGSEMFQAR
jgi:hypothetical protein